MLKAYRPVLTALLLALTLALVWFVWTLGQQLVATVVILLAATGLAGILNPGQAPAETLPDPEAPARRPIGWGRSLLGGLAALALTWVAFGAALKEQWALLAGSLFLAGLCWRLALPAALPSMGRGVWMVLAALAVAVAAWYRLHRLGELPTGLAGVDEALLWFRAHAYARGLRQSYAIGDNLFDGVIPFYLQALGLKVFGNSFWGWRMEGALAGIFTTVLVWGLAREAAGRWAALAASAFWAFALWPVTFSRAHYLMAETYVVALACLLLLLLAVRKGNGLLWAFAGLFWGLSFNVYTAARIHLALVPWGLILVWLFSPPYRATIRKGIVPLLAGLLIGLSPLILWAVKEPAEFRNNYFMAFYQGNMAGSVDGSLLQRIGGVLLRCIDFFPHSFWLFTKRGPVNANYFPLQYPLMQPALLFLFLAGFSICLARFRRPLHAFLLYWWLIAFIPAVASAPGTTPNDRRLMMALPVTLIMAGMGLSTLLGLLTGWMAGRLRAAVMLALMAAVLVPMGRRSWHDYFERNQNDYGLLAWNRANGAGVLKAVAAENAKGACVLVSTRRLNTDSWVQPSMNPYRGPEWPATNPDLPVAWCQENAEYFEKGGLLGRLRWAVQQRRPPAEEGQPEQPYSVLVALTPFHFYLEPLLLELGGKVVAEVPMLRATQGLMRDDAGFAFDEKLLAKLVRIEGLTLEALQRLEPDRLYRFQLQALEPPRPLTREEVFRMNTNLPGFRSLADAYAADPRAWRPAGPPAQFSVLDPWFWQSHGNLPGGAHAPWRLTASFSLDIPADGEYAFGASATGLATVRIDGRKVFQRDATDPKNWNEKQALDFTVSYDELEFENERRGYVGRPLRLAKGRYRLDYELSKLSIEPNFNDVVRLVWQPPSGPIQTLPLEVARPWPGPR